MMNSTIRSLRIDPGEILDPRIRKDRIRALINDITSHEKECPFYDPSLTSYCRLEPRVWNSDCKGMCFRNGFCCSRVLTEFLDKP